MIVKATNHIKFTCVNPPITELITINIATIIYPTKLENFLMENLLILDIVSTVDVFSNSCIFFLREIMIVMINW